MSNPIDNGPRFNGNSAVRGTGSSQRTGTERTDERSEAQAPAVAGGDTSVASERLQAVRERIDSTPEVDMDRVEAIKRSIAEGRYPIDPERIAQKFGELEGLLND